MAEAEQQQQVIAGDQQKQPAKPKEVIATKVTGTVKWFNVKSGYGFINRSDTKEDVFVHQSAIVKNNPKKAVRSVGDGETVEFSVVVGEKGNEAANVTGPNGEPVRGSPYAADRRPGYRRWIGYPRRGRVGGGPRGPPRQPRESQSEGEGKEVSGGDGGPPRRYRPRRGRGGYGGGGGGGYYRQPYNNRQDQDQNGEGGSVPRGRGGPPRRFFRRHFRGGRQGGGGGRRPQSQDSHQGGEQQQQDGRQNQQQRPRYRRRGGNNQQRQRRGNSQSDAGNKETQSVQNTTTESTA